MKKLLLILILAIMCSSVVRADDRGELFRAAFKKALQNHLYFFKFENKFYTTNTKEKEFDFFDHGYDYHEASAYMKKNYTVSNGVSDGNYGCMLYKGELHHFRDYLDYDKNGWKNKVIITSANKSIKVIFNEDNGCLWRDTYIQVLFEDKIFYDSRKDFEELTSDGWSISLNINHYIDKDLNKNGKQELFIDAGYTVGNNWLEEYYFFEYDESSIKLVKKFLAGDWTQRLGISDHFKQKFTVSEEELANVIYKNFSESKYVECIEGDCINGKGIFDGKNGIKYVGEFKDGKYHGQGTETFQNRFKYVGEFKDGLHHGRGILIYISDGDKYVGEFKDGAQEGQGTYTYSNGDKYIGEFKDGLYNGQGTKIYADGHKYIGGWKINRKTGQGTLTYADGTKFTGEWNEFEGIFTHSDGTKFVGEWDWKKGGIPIK